jgi:hypothetical protein
MTTWRKYSPANLAPGKTRVQAVGDNEKEAQGRSKAYYAKPSRGTLILAALERVELAANQLSQLSPLDPRFADALNEYRDALDARDAAVNTRRS